MTFSGMILSGGRSSRMGRQKASLPFGTSSLLGHVAERLALQAHTILISSNDPVADFPEATVVRDRFADFPGPLAGIHAALAHIAESSQLTTTHIAVVTVDTPFFPADLVSRLAERIGSPNDFSLARSHGRLHPLTGLWPISSLSALEAWLVKPPSLKVRAFLDGKHVESISFDDYSTLKGPLDPFFNINTPDDLATAIAFHEVINGN